MIEKLRRLRDLLDVIDRQFDDPDDRDPTAIDEAQDIIESLICQHERPVPPKKNACMRLPTPAAPAPPPIPVKPPRPENQRPHISKPRKKKTEIAA